MSIQKTTVTALTLMLLACAIPTGRCMAMDINAKIPIEEESATVAEEYYDPFDPYSDDSIYTTAWDSEGYTSAQDDTEWVDEVMSVNVSEAAKREFVEYIGPICMADEVISGVPASVTLAQAILESGWGQSGLSRNANNLFGIKASASKTSWSEYSYWDGVSYYETLTGEETESGAHITITAKFRAYADIKESIADHSAYLVHAMNGDRPRYPGIAGCGDYRLAFQIIQAGGYATSHTYAADLCSLVEQYDLTRFDVNYDYTAAYQE